jgi:hypothetical protein
MQSGPGPSQPHVTDEEMKTVSAGIWHSALSIRPYLQIIFQHSNYFSFAN